MLKKLLIAGGIVLLLIIGALVWLSQSMKPSATSIYEYIADHPEDCSLVLHRDGEELVSISADIARPLASSVKTVIAIEYAHQAAAGLIEPNEMISLSELEHYYISGTDGGAHPAWLKHDASEIYDDKVSIANIVKGMIWFSSNANTEWLQDRLGLVNINNRLDSLGLSSHQDLIYLVSSQALDKDESNLRGDLDMKESLRAMSQDEYAQACERTHAKLKADTSYAKSCGLSPLPLQRVWSDRLTSASAADYLKIMKMLNSKTDFTPEVYEYLETPMQAVMSNPANSTWLKHSGGKGGSTGWVLTKAMYATDSQDHTTELVYFMDNLGVIKNMQLQASINEFEKSVLQSEEFRQKLLATVLSKK